MLQITSKLMRNVLGQPQSPLLLQSQTARRSNATASDGEDKSSTSDAKLDAMRELISDLQEQLRKARLELRRAQNAREDDNSRLRIQNASAKVSGLTTALQMAYGQMLTALRKGGGSGALVDTRA